MTRISTLCVLSGTLALLALSANAASAGTFTPHTNVPVAKPSIHLYAPAGGGTGGGAGKVLSDSASPKLFVRKAGGTQMEMRKAGGDPGIYSKDPELCCSGNH